jgi:hypothetical protein
MNAVDLASIIAESGSVTFDLRMATPRHDEETDEIPRASG